MSSRATWRAAWSRVSDATSTLYALIAAITIFDVAARFLFRAPTTWALEVVQALCALQFLAAVVAVDAANGHLRLDLFVVRLEGARRFLADLVAAVAAGIFSIGFLYGAILQALPALRSWETSGSVVDLPAPVIVKAAIAVAAAAMAVGASVRLWRAVRGGA